MRKHFPPMPPRSRYVKAGVGLFLILGVLSCYIPWLWARFAAFALFGFWFGWLVWIDAVQSVDKRMQKKIESDGYRFIAGLYQPVDNTRELDRWLYELRQVLDMSEEFTDAAVTMEAVRTIKKSKAVQQAMEKDITQMATMVEGQRALLNMPKYVPSYRKVRGDIDPNTFLPYR